MLRVTLRKVRIAEDVVQSSLSPSGETLRVAAVLELSPSAPARPSVLHLTIGKNLGEIRLDEATHPFEPWLKNLVNPVNPV